MPFVCVADPARLAAIVGAAVGKFGSDGTLDVPFAKDDEETINPARTRAVYSC